MIPCPLYLAFLTKTFMGNSRVVEEKPDVLSSNISNNPSHLLPPHPPIYNVGSQSRMPALGEQAGEQVFANRHVIPRRTAFGPIEARAPERPAGRRPLVRRGCWPIPCPLPCYRARRPSLLRRGLLPRGRRRGERRVREPSARAVPRVQSHVVRLAAGGCRRSRRPRGGLALRPPGRPALGLRRGANHEERSWFPALRGRRNARRREQAGDEAAVQEVQGRQDEAREEDVHGDDEMAVREGDAAEGVRAAAAGRAAASRVAAGAGAGARGGASEWLFRAPVGFRGQGDQGDLVDQ